MAWPEQPELLFQHVVSASDESFAAFVFFLEEQSPSLPDLLRLLSSHAGVVLDRCLRLLCGSSGSLAVRMSTLIHNMARALPHDLLVNLHLQCISIKPLVQALTSPRLAVQASLCASLWSMAESDPGLLLELLVGSSSLDLLVGAAMSTEVSAASASLLADALGSLGDSAAMQHVQAMLRLALHEIAAHANARAAGLVARLAKVPTGSAFLAQDDQHTWLLLCSINMHVNSEPGHCAAEALLEAASHPQVLEALATFGVMPLVTALRAGGRGGSAAARTLSHMASAGGAAQHEALLGLVPSIIQAVHALVLCGPEDELTAATGAAVVCVLVLSGNPVAEGHALGCSRLLFDILDCGGLPGTCAACAIRHLSAREPAWRLFANHRGVESLLVAMQSTDDGDYPQEAAALALACLVKHSADAALILCSVPGRVHVLVALASRRVKASLFGLRVLVELLARTDLPALGGKGLVWLLGGDAMRMLATTLPVQQLAELGVTVFAGLARFDGAALMCTPLLQMLESAAAPGSACLAYIKQRAASVLAAVQEQHRLAHMRMTAAAVQAAGTHASRDNCRLLADLLQLQEDALHARALETKLKLACA